MSKLLFLDIETTGLDEQRGLILEVSAIVTDSKLEELGQYSQVVWYPEPTLLKQPMDEWVQTTHRKSGLFDEIKTSTANLSTTEERLASFIATHFVHGKAIMAGNSIHFDRRWIRHHMPHVESLLHYRMIDASGMNEAFAMIAGVQVEKPVAKHRGLSDVRDSISLLKRLMEHVKVQTV